MLDEIFGDTEAKINRALDESLGYWTLSLDGFTDVRGRCVLNVVVLAAAFSSFYLCKYYKTKRHTGKEACNTAEDCMNSLGLGRFAGVITDNTESMVVMRNLLRVIFPLLIMVKCCAHVLDLLCESLAKIDGIAQTLADAKALVAFAKGMNCQLFELYLELHAVDPSKPVTLRFFPDTRFAYAPLMIESVVANKFVLMKLIDHQKFRREARAFATPAQRKKMDAAVALIQDSSLWTRLNASLLVLSPVASVLKYLSGDDVPISHVYVCYQALMDEWKQMSEVDIDFTLGDGTYDAVKAALDLRWTGDRSTRHVGLYDFELLAAFELDPTLRFHDAFKHLCTVDSVAAVNKYFDREAQGDRERLLALRLSYDKYLTGAAPYAELRRLAGSAPIDDQAPDFSRATVNIPKLITFLSSLKSTYLITVYGGLERMLHDTDSDSTHFATASLKLLSVRPHACAIERANKSHRFLHDKLRVRLKPLKVHKLIYTYHNLPLVHGSYDKSQKRPDFETFVLGMVDKDDEGVVHEIMDEMEWEALAAPAPLPPPLPAPPAEAPAAGEQAAEAPGEEEAGTTTMVAPDGYACDDVRPEINDDLVNRLVIVKWEQPNLWYLGKVTMLLKYKYKNVELFYADEDGPRNQMLDPKKYTRVGDETSPPGSWCALKVASMPDTRM